MQHELAQLGGGAHALAVQILGNSHDAADAVHDAFETALARPDRYDARKGALRPWFLRVDRNRCIDMLRRRHGSDMPVYGWFFEGSDVTFKTPSGQPVMTSAPIADILEFLRSVQN